MSVRVKLDRMVEVVRGTVMKVEVTVATAIVNENAILTWIEHGHGLILLL